MGGRVRAVVSVTQQMFLPFTCRWPDWRPNYLNVPHKTLLFACVLFFYIKRLWFTSGFDTQGVFFLFTMFTRQRQKEGNVCVKVLQILLYVRL